MMLDLSVSEQSYIEDCERCCHPIQVTFTVEDDEVVGLDILKGQ